jgi:hypothetical protein
MTTKITGASERRTLSLHFGGKRTAGTFPEKTAPYPMPNHELRRLVAAMVD